MIAVVGLAQDDEDISGNSDWMAAIAYKIIKRAEALGIRRQDIVIDCTILVEGATCSPHPAGDRGDGQYSDSSGGRATVIHGGTVSPVVHW